MKRFKIKYKEQYADKVWRTKYKFINAESKNQAIVKLDKWPKLIVKIEEIEKEYYENN
tara:strand:+ start:665 stop:838 length:174 start_codon:yes stop_codon:yes gene_type:complete